MPSGESLCRLRIKRCHPEERSDEESALLFHAPTLLALLALTCPESRGSSDGLFRVPHPSCPELAKGLKGGSCLCSPGRPPLLRRPGAFALVCLRCHSEEHSGEESAFSFRL